MDVFIGFDSAWTDNQKAPGAICALELDGDVSTLHAPALSSFSQALSFIRNVKSKDGMTLIAIDQPTIVRNTTSMRPVERVAASLVSWLGGGVQPSNRGRTGMFCDNSPIWQFLADLEAVEDPEASRILPSELHIIEVFPALALASLDPRFFGRLSGPKYNPAKPSKFRSEDWKRVTEVAEAEATAFNCEALAAWCRDANAIAAPRKADQDRLDSALCLLVAMKWRLRPRETSMLLGDLENGYMVFPASAQVRCRLTVAARKNAVPIDGLMVGATGIEPVTPPV